MLCSRTGSYSYSCRELEASRVVQCFYLYLHTSVPAAGLVSHSENTDRRIYYIEPRRASMIYHRFATTSVKIDTNYSVETLDYI